MIEANKIENNDGPGIKVGIGNKYDKFLLINYLEQKSLEMILKRILAGLKFYLATHSFLIIELIRIILMEF